MFNVAVLLGQYAVAYVPSLYNIKWQLYTMQTLQLVRL